MRGACGFPGPGSGAVDKAMDQRGNSSPGSGGASGALFR